MRGAQQLAKRQLGRRQRGPSSPRLALPLVLPALKMASPLQRLRPESACGPPT